MKHLSMSRLTSYLILLFVQFILSSCQYNRDCPRGVSAEEFQGLVGNCNYRILDCRSEEKFAEKHIEGSLFIDADNEDFVDIAKEYLDVSDTIAVYGDTNEDAVEVCKILDNCELPTKHRRGFKTVYLKGGLKKWIKGGYPTYTSMPVLAKDIISGSPSHFIKGYVIEHEF